MRPPKRGSLADDVAEELRRRVLAGEFAPGERLPTGSELSASFGVSLSVVREAMSRLKHDGLIHSVQGAGAFVTPHGRTRAFRLDDTGGTRNGLQRIFELRQAVEGEAARLAAQRRTPQHLNQLRAALEAMEQAVADDAAATRADNQFHQIIAEATGNSLFTEMYAFLSAHIAMAIEAARTHSALRGTWREALDEHMHIYSALEAADPDAARQAILDHIVNAANRLGVNG